MRHGACEVGSPASCLRTGRTPCRHQHRPARSWSPPGSPTSRGGERAETGRRRPGRPARSAETRVSADGDRGKRRRYERTVSGRAKIGHHENFISPTSFRPADQLRQPQRQVLDTWSRPGSAVAPTPGVVRRLVAQHEDDSERAPCSDRPVWRLAQGQRPEAAGAVATSRTGRLLGYATAETRAYGPWLPSEVAGRRVAAATDAVRIGTADGVARARPPASGPSAMTQDPSATGVIVGTRREPRGDLSAASASGASTRQKIFPCSTVGFSQRPCLRAAPASSVRGVPARHRSGRRTTHRVRPRTTPDAPFARRLAPRCVTMNLVTPSADRGTTGATIRRPRPRGRRCWTFDSALQLASGAIFPRVPRAGPTQSDRPPRSHPVGTDRPSSSPRRERHLLGRSA
jgi:hypothetical protein